MTPDTLHTLLLLVEASLVLVFYFYLHYTIASLLTSASVCASLYYDYKKAERQSLWGALVVRGIFKTALHLTVLFAYLPEKVEWYTILLGFLLVMLKVTEYLTEETRRERWFGIGWNLLSPVALAFYSAEITPPPDRQLSISFYSWIRALGIFGYLIAWCVYVIVAAHAATKGQDEDSDVFLLEEVQQ